MRSAGTSIVHVMDDFLVIVPQEKGPICALTAQVNLLRELARMRLKISWKKVHPDGLCRQNLPSAMANPAR
jgi:hypothetical protein